MSPGRRTFFADCQTTSSCLVYSNGITLLAGVQFLSFRPSMIWSFLLLIGVLSVCSAVRHITDEERRQAEEMLKKQAEKEPRIEPLRFSPFRAQLTDEFRREIMMLYAGLEKGTHDASDEESHHARMFASIPENFPEGRPAALFTISPKRKGQKITKANLSVRLRRPETVTEQKAVTVTAYELKDNGEVEGVLGTGTFELPEEHGRTVDVKLDPEQIMRWHNNTNGRRVYVSVEAPYNGENLAIHPGDKDAGAHFSARTSMSLGLLISHRHESIRNLLSF